MEDFNSKYSGEQVEALLDQVASGNAGGGGGGIAVETDPIFSASPAASITEAKIAEWDGKQDAIADLATIRSGAEKGATALQSIPEEYVTESELSAKGYVTTVQLDGKVDKVDGKQLSAEDFTSAFKSKLESLNNYDDTELSNALATLREDFDKLVSGDTTTAIKTFNEVIAFLDGIADTEDLAGIIASIEQQIAGKMDKVTLATVATSGSYNDLSNKPTIPAEQVNADWNATSGKAQILNKPTIPSAVTESTVSGWGFTKNTGTYSKPSGGIPKSDLASAVQTSLGKADTALQSYTEQYKGTITGVSANGTSVATSGVANIPAASTSKYGVTKLSSATNSTSTTLAATASAVKSAYDLANGKQDKLVSGTNIKTINGTSILGSGNITISGGGGGTSGGGKEFVEIEPLFSPGGYEGSFGIDNPMQPNKVYVFTEAMDALYINVIETSSAIGDEYTIMFTANRADMLISIIVEMQVYWANGTIPPISAGDLCELSLVRIGSNIKAVLTTFKPE